MVARVLWEHLELVQVQLFRPEAVLKVCQVYQKSWSGFAGGL